MTLLAARKIILYNRICKFLATSRLMGRPESVSAAGVRDTAELSERVRAIPREQSDIPRVAAQCEADFPGIASPLRCFLSAVVGESRVESTYVALWRGPQFRAIAFYILGDWSYNSGDIVRSTEATLSAAMDRISDAFRDLRLELIDMPYRANPSLHPIAFEGRSGLDAVNDIGRSLLEDSCEDPSFASAHEKDAELPDVVWWIPGAADESA